MKIEVLPKGKPYIMLRLGVGPIYAEKGGGLVLKTDVSWKKLSGLWINTPKGCVWIYLRRYHYSLKLK
jgi:hypothetical protein